MSQKYSFTNTYEIVKYAQTKGFSVSSIMGGTTAYAALIVRMRMLDHGKKEDGGAPELVIGDSHNGTKPAKLLLGYINFLCLNGMVAGDMLYSRRFLHRSPDLMQQLRLELEDIDTSVRKLMLRVNAMRAYNTTVGEQIALTDAAMQERFITRSDQTLSGDFKVDMRRKLLTRRRDGDKRNDMFTIMNVVQENLIRGGSHYISSTSNMLIRMKPIAAVDRNLNINQRIWIEAERIMSNALQQDDVLEHKHDVCDNN